MIELSVTLGLIFSLLSFEVFGLAAGGIVVPGYMALMLSNPDRLIGIFIVSVLTYLIVRGIGNITFLYGRRQMVLSILIGCLIAIFSRNFLYLELSSGLLQLKAVGWVVPGLIAHWYARQGIFRTIAVLLITAVLVRLIVILLFNGDLLPG